ncbi:MAG TPA: DUF6701 domain-containing protein [Noviherbaspirillum sp.]|nr:DUF6701 domain-containing protein [Noviherbaspirillum sp.]
MRKDGQHVLPFGGWRSKYLCVLASLLLLFLTMSADVAAQIAFRSAATAAVQPPISYVGVGTAVSGSSGNVTVGMPAGYQGGDLLLCLVESHDNVSHTTTTAGWSRLYLLTPSATQRASLFWKVAGDGTESSLTVVHTAGNSITARCAAFRGVDNANPFDAAYASASSGSDNTVESGSLTTLTSQAWVLFAAHIADRPANTTMPSGWTQAFHSQTSLGSDSAVALFYRGPLAANTAVGPEVATMTSRTGESNGVLIALRPAKPNTLPSNALTINKPAGTVEGDVLVASISVAPDIITATAPAGWTLLRQLSQTSGGTSRLQTYYKVSAASEPSNYTWNFSANTHAVGGIAAFSGADPNYPVDVEAGATNVTAPTITTTQADSMLVTIHEHASATTWLPPAGMSPVFNIASTTVPSAGGVSMAMNYELRPTPGATGTRQPTVGAGPDFGAAQSLSLKPIGGMSCYTDTFTSASSGNWLVGRKDGSFTPVMTNNKFRLTDNSARASTYATLQKLFPAAGNKIVIEFQHYAYNGSGADGITAVLSDASQPPVAGAFGGSLGYAPKRADAGGDTTAEGFSGGWLGIALDEYGNFSADAEGRTSVIPAPGFTPDAIAIRGSGAGYSGYSYLKGKALSPGVDNAGSTTAAPGYKYRITVDHSDGVKALTKVERDINDGAGYRVEIPEFDSKAEPGQAAVPVNWYLSFTGATGGSSNIHEIGNLKVCSNTLQNISLHHIELENSGTTCDIGSVIVKACANADCTALYPGSVTVNLNSTDGTWSRDPVTFTGGQTTVTLTKYTSGTVTLSGTATSPVAPYATTCYNGTSTPCVLRFVSTCFDAVQPGAGPATPIFTKLANTSFTLDVLALSNPTTIDSRYDGNVQVSLVNPNAASGNCSDANPGLTSAQTRTITNGRGNVTFNYANAAKNVKVRITSGTQSICSKDNFAIRPAQLTLSTTPASGTVAAGANFTLTASSELGGGYTGTPTVSSINIKDHNNAAIEVGSLTGTFSAATGVAANGIFQYNDVGNIKFEANATPDLGFTAVDQVTGIVDGVDHGGTGDCISASTSNVLSSGRYGCRVGSNPFTPSVRFRPDHYEVDATLGAACNGFTYMGQDALGLYLNVKAVSANGALTRKLTLGYANLPVLSVAGEDGSTSITLSTRLSDPSFPTAQWTSGVFTVSSAANTPSLQEKFKFNRLSSGAVDGSFENFKLKIGVTDSDNAKITKLNGSDIAPADTVLSAATKIRYGRARMINAYGSELLPLPIPFLTEYFLAGTGWVTNVDDSCTQVPVPVQLPGSGLVFAADTLKNKLAAGEVVARMRNSSGASITTGNGSFSLGSGQLRLTHPTLGSSGPGTGNYGYVTITPTVPDWLKFNWMGTGDINPSARATFGVYRGSPVIYLREIY